MMCCLGFFSVMWIRTEDADPDPDPEDKNRRKCPKKGGETLKKFLFYLNLIQDSFHQIEYCKNYKTNITLYDICVFIFHAVFTPWIRICMEADADPGSGSA